MIWRWLSNLLDWGEVYEKSWWGIGAETNDIGWGIIYKAEASQDTWQYQSSYYQDEIDVWNQI